MESSDLSEINNSSSIAKSPTKDPPIFDDLDVFVPAKNIIWASIEKKKQQEKEEEEKKKQE